MRQLIVTWPYALIYWSVVLWAYLPELLLNRRSRPLAGAQDAGSFALVMVVHGVSIGVGYVIGFVLRLGAMPGQPLWFWISVGLMIGGSLLRRHCFRMLGRSFTAVVVVAPGQMVVERGAYRWVRHPSYTAGILMLGGQILALGNWVAVAVVVLAVAVAYSYRVRVEERALVATLGQPYRDYMQRTKRFVPLLV